jgi:hypothetical protein
MSIGQNNLPETLNMVADWLKNFEFKFSILQGGDNANMQEKDSKSGRSTNITL